MKGGANGATPPQSSSSPTEPIVVFDDVSIGFEQKPVLENISFQVRPGEMRILLGPAGVGKTGCSVAIAYCCGGIGSSIGAQLARPCIMQSWSRSMSAMVSASQTPALTRNATTTSAMESPQNQLNAALQN